MTISIYLFRHGETDYNLKNNLFGGRSNFLELNNRGKEQARALGERLKKEGIKFDKIYSSTSKRAIQTAEIACNAAGFLGEIISADELLEISHGDWEGKPRSEVYTEENIKKMDEKGWEFKAPGGESQKEVEERVWNFVNNKILISPDKNIAIFSHGMSIKCLIRRILEHNPNITHRTHIGNCSISIFKYNREGRHSGWSLVKINDNSHLSDMGFNKLEFT